MIVRRDVIEAFLDYYMNYPVSLRCSRLAMEDLALWFFVDRLSLKTAYVPSVAVFHSLPETRTRLRYLNWLNFRMVFAYSQLVNFERKKMGMGVVLRSTLKFAKNSFFMKPNNAAAIWLKTVRIAGYMAGCLKVKLP